MVALSFDYKWDIIRVEGGHGKEVSDSNKIDKSDVGEPV